MKLFRNSRPTTIPNNHQTVPHNVLSNNYSNTQVLTVSPIDSTNATIHPNHSPPGNTINSSVSPSIQSRIDKLCHNTLNTNLKHPLLEDLGIKIF